MRINLRFVSVVALSSVLGILSPAQTGTTPKAANARAHAAIDFTLPDQNKVPFHLADHKGKSLLLLFYQSYWCPYCTLQLRQFAKHRAEFSKMNVELVAIGSDDVENAYKVWETRLDKQYNVLSDPAGETARKYSLIDGSTKADSAPMSVTMLLDENGVEQWRIIAKHVDEFPNSVDILKRIQGGEHKK